MAFLFIAQVLAASKVSAQTLVGDPFVSPYSAWVDPFPAPTRLGNWRLSLHTPNLIETNNANPPTTGGGTNTGRYEPNVLIQNNFAAPGTYDLNATMRTNDDDLLGLVWNFQDANNYFRVGLRQQPASGNFGGTEGLSVQKVVGGVVTQLFPVGNVAGPAAIDQAMIDARTPFDVKVAVNGANYEVFFNGASYTSGTDADLASGRKVGVQSWAQQADAAAVTPFWGTEVDAISVTQGANTLFSQTFAARPIPWRPLVMTNANGVSTTTTASKEDIGNFGLDINDPWILQHSNGFENATFENVDFIGPAVVVDTPGSASFSNYQMRTRLGAADNDGIGVLVRVQDDNNFYRINFTNEATDAGLTTRSPQGMSVQEVRNGVWTELYRDDTAPLFVYTPGAAGTNPATPGFPAFDLQVGAVGNQLKIQVRDHMGNVINYPLITDASDPILTGTVGLHTWGTDNTYYTGYGGQSGPLLTTLSAFTAFDVTVNRTTGNITLTNNGAAPVNIKGVIVGSTGGGLNPATWMPIATFYDEPPGNGSVDPDDPWTIISSTATSLSEREQSVGGNGATLAVGQSINFGNAWIKSRFEDVTVDLELFNGTFTSAGVDYSGGPGGLPYHRSDLNVDGVVNANDWPIYFPNMLTDMSSLTAVNAALAGDLDLDGDNDVNDFALFKADFDAANGVGAFNAMLAGVPEPSSIALVLVGGLGWVACRRSFKKTAPAVVTSLALAALASPAAAAPVDLTTYTVEAFPPAASFAMPNWTITPTTATHPSNADASVVYSPDSALNKRFIGTLTPGTDDDVVGFVLGFEPGDAQVGSSADYLLIDWKGASQSFNFADGGTFPIFFHDSTGAGNMPVGLALSRVTGSPTADEFWQHVDLPENATGSVAELDRGTTLGSAPYNRTGGSHEFDIVYTPTRVTVKVDGVQQFDLMGSFPDGRFGLYSAWQGPQPTFADFKVFSSGFAGLSAIVDRSNGNITLRNTGTDPFQFDFYQFDSASNSLNPGGWNSLSDQNFQSIGAGNGQSWDEAGGSDPSELAEAYLQSASTLAGNASVSIGNAYNHIINGEDLVLQFRLPTTGELLNGAVQYIGEAPTLDGDYDGDADVDGNDFLVWLRGLGTVGPHPADGNGNNMVDGGDLTVWRNNFGANPAVGAATAVPEPAALALALCMAAIAPPYRRRQAA